MRNGTVTGFGYGVLLTPGTTRVVVEGLTITRNAVSGIEFFDADNGRTGNTARNNTILDNELGITLIAGTQDATIQGNTIHGSFGEAILVQHASSSQIGGLSDGEGNEIVGIPTDPNLDSDGGVLLEDSHHIVFEGNILRDTGDAGFVISLGSHHNRLEGNTMYRNGDAGVYIQDSDWNEVINNLAHQESDGGVVLSNADNTKVIGNDLQYNPNGIETADSNNLLIEGNDGSNSSQDGFAIGNGVNLVVRNNIANLTGGTGISLEGAAFDALGIPVGTAVVEGNTANENDGAGIAIADGAGHLVRNNRAYHNAEIGITAEGNVDGGGNQAAGNGAPSGPGEVTEQCLGVVCTDGTIPPIQLTMDQTPPETVIDSGPTNPTPNNSASFKFSATDLKDDGTQGTPPTGLVFECRLDPPPDPPEEPVEPEDPEPPHPNEPPDTIEPFEGLNWMECISPVHFHFLEPGVHRFEVRATDQARPVVSDNPLIPDLDGFNVDLTPAVYEWTIDALAQDPDIGPQESVPPETRIAYGPAAQTASRTAVLGFAGSDNRTSGFNLEFECRLLTPSDQAATFGPCITPASYAGLDAGLHTFEVRAIDKWDNVDATPAVHAWTIIVPPGDTTAPETSIDGGPDGVTVLTTATFQFSSNDETATFECRLDTDAPDQWTACTSPQEFTNVAVGPRTFQVRAADQATPTPNVDQTPATYSWEVGSAPVLGQVFCGMTIRQSTKVKNDLADCIWDGLVIGAAGITIDLDGHTIDGKGLGAGIRNDGFDNVTIKNGRIVDFDYGVALNVGTEKNIVEALILEQNQEAGVSLGTIPQPDPVLGLPTPEQPPSSFQSGVLDNTVRNNQIRANDHAIWLTNNASNTLIKDNEIAAHGNDAILVERSHGNRIEANSIEASSGTGIALKGSRDNLVLNNLLEDNGGGGILIGLTDGPPAPDLPSNDNRVEKNTIVESGGSAIEVAGNSKAYVTGNDVIDNIAHRSNGDGIFLIYANDTLVRGNDVRANKGGISLMGSSHNHIELNDASESEGTGISLEALSLDNVLLRNTSSTNDGDGIYVGDETSGGSGMTVDGNTTNNNKGYGIFVPKVSHLLKNNTANDNGGWGIWVAEASNGRVNIDGGGNRAQGNTGATDPLTLKPLQCFVIRCEGGPIPQSDAIAPNTILTDTPPANNKSTQATFRFTGTDNASSVTFQCSLDGSSWEPCQSPHQVSGLNLLENHVFDVRAVDVSGNVDLTPAHYSWWVDPAPEGEPAITAFDAYPDKTTVKTNATFEFSSNEDGTSFDCYLDADPLGYRDCSSPKTYAGLSVGVHTFYLQATDLHGNITPSSYTWEITPAPVARQVTCGEVLVQSVKVLNDLIDCPSNGLVIGTGKITLDLNGHIIDGKGIDAGIVNMGFDSVTITNGTVNEFDYGVLLNPGSGLNVVSDIHVEMNQEAGIALADADEGGEGNIIRDNTIVSNGMGIWVLSGTRNALIKNNALAINMKDGVRLEHATGNNILYNEIAGSNGAGIVLIASPANYIAHNELNANDQSAVILGEELLPSNGNTVEHNTVSEGGGGFMVVDSTENEILVNVVHDVLGPALVMELAYHTTVRGNDFGSSKSGIEMEESSYNLIESNNVSGTMGTGIMVGALSAQNVVRLNTANTNSGEGIAIEDSAPMGQGTLLELNVTDGNGGDGIYIAGVGHILENNSSRLNGGWGIYAAVGATVRGVNFAAGNIEPQQCYNVFCTVGAVPGEPNAWFVEKPPKLSHSRNAYFTYMGSDEVSLVHELVFECRIDSFDPLAWEDCEYPAEFLNLMPGEHTAEIRAIDQLGAGLPDSSPDRYTWTYQPLPPNDPPEVIFDIVPEEFTWALDAIFTFHSDEPDVTFECTVDQFGWEPCGWEGAQYMSYGSFEWGLEETEVGPHTIYVRAVDFEGNESESFTYTWNLLGVATIFLPGPAPETTGYTPPETPQDPATGGETMSTTAVIAFDANVADATFECSIDLEPFVACTSPVTYTGLLAGDHNLRVIATAGEMSELEAAEYEWSIADLLDTAPPDTSIELMPDPNSSETIFEFEGTDDLTPPEWLIFECRIDSTNNLDWFECLSPFNLLDEFTYEDAQMAPGTHTFEVRAIDMAENPFESPSDPNPNFEGNPDPTPATYTWTSIRDTEPPITTIVLGPENNQRLGLIDSDFEFSGRDNATPALELEFQCVLDNEPWPFEVGGLPQANCESPYSAQGLLPGVHTVKIRAIDMAGNVDLTPATRTWIVVAAPITRITSGPATLNTQGDLLSTTDTAVFVFGADQPGVTYECSLDDGAGLVGDVEPWVPCVSPVAHHRLAPGEHSFQVRATNPEGVIEELATPCPPEVAAIGCNLYEWTVELGPDTVPPNTTITSGPPAVDQLTVATFEFTGSDNRAGDLSFQCALDGQSYNSCTSPDQWSDLVRGTHVLLVRARDQAGLWDPTPARYEWVLAAPPITAILNAPAEITESTTARFVFQADVPSSTYWCWLDGVLEEDCTSPREYTGLAQGEHYFAVLAWDPNGIVEEQWVDWEWRIGDMTAPLVFIDEGPDIQSQTVAAMFVFHSNESGVSFTCSLDGSDPLPCTSPLTIPRLEPGPHEMEILALHPLARGIDGELLDPLYEDVPTIYAWTVVDFVPPETAIRYGPASTTTSMSAYFGFATDDPTAIIECSLDFEGFGGCEAPFALEDLLEGEHVLHVRAVDTSDNTDPTPAVWRWTVTRGTPNTPAGRNVTVELPMPGGLTADLNFFEISVAGHTGLEPLAGGPPIDLVGYGSARYFDIHTTAAFGEPIRLCMPYRPNDFVDGPARIIHFSGSEWKDITITNDPVAGVVCAEPADFSVFALVQGSPFDPLARIISGPDQLSETNSATFVFASDVPETMVQCSLDGLPWTLCESPLTFRQLEVGNHKFEVEAIGAFTIDSPRLPTLYEWEIVLPLDTTPPNTQIVKGPPSIIGSPVIQLEFTGSDDQTIDIDLEFECLLDGILIGSCSSIVTTPTVVGVPYELEVEEGAYGRHTVTVRAIDEWGNVDPTPATRTWTYVDVNSPDTSIEIGPEEETEGTIAVFEFTGEDYTGVILSDFECSLDNADFAHCESPVTIEGLTIGAHHFQVRAVSPSGVVDSTPELYEWLVIPPLDAGPPDTLISHTPQNPSGPDVIFGFQSDQLVEDFECSIDGEQYSGCEAVLELEGLEPGQHTISVRALRYISEVVDPTPATFTWTVVGEPDTEILTGPPAISGRASATFTFTSDQSPNVTYYCSVDGALPVICTSPFIAGPLPQDAHEFEVYATNDFFYLDGERVQDQEPATYEWEVMDVTPPDTQILSVVFLGPTDLVEPETFRFELAGTDNGTAWFELEFECSLDGGPWDGCDRPFHYLPIEELPGGEHTMLVRAVDEFENVDPTPASHTFSTEAGPETTILTGPDPETGDTEVTFTFSANPAAGATFECSLDLGLFVACPNPYTTIVPLGDHELLVRAKGPLGAVDIEPAEWSWYSGDVTAPVVTIHTGPPPATLSTTAEFTFSVDDPEASLQCSLDGAPPAFCESPLTLTEADLAIGDGHASGEHTLNITPVKLHLLAEGEGATWTWIVDDVTAPNTTIESTPPAEISSELLSLFAFSSNEAGVTFECSLDPAPVPIFEGCADPPENTAEFSGLLPGTHRLLVRAVDPSLNVDPTPAEFSWTVVGAALTTITADVPADNDPLNPDVTTTQTSATFNWTADQAGVSFTCSYDGADFAPCTSPVTIPDVTVGQHAFEVQSTNQYLLIEEPPASYSWTVEVPVDVILPDTEILTSPLDPSTSSSPSFTFAADQGGVTYECSLDMEAFTTCTSPKSYLSVAEGEHLFRVRAVHSIGIPDQSPAEHEWTIDLVPETYIDSGPASLTINTFAIFNFASNEGFATFECALDSPSWSSCPGDGQFLDLLAGSHLLRVRAVDVSGNVDPTPATHRWTIGPGPDTFIQSGPEEIHPSTTATFTFGSNLPNVTFECSIDEAAENLFFLPCPSTYVLTDLALGEHELLVRAVDPAGNVDLIPAEWSWEVGGIAPPVYIESGPDVTTTDRSARFEFTAEGTGLMFWCSLTPPDGEANEGPCLPGKAYNGLGLGFHVFQVHVLVGEEALTEPPIATWEWTVIDTTGLDTTITEGPPDVTGGVDPEAGGDAQVPFFFVANDNRALFQCAVDGEQWNECESPFMADSLGLGAHIFRVRAVIIDPNDSTVNADPTPAMWQFTVVEAPDTTIDIGPEAEIISGPARFYFSSTVGGSTFECAIDLGPFFACSNPYEVAQGTLADGEHMLEVRSITPLGVRDMTPDEWSWDSDTLLPETTILSGPRQPTTTSTAAAFTFSASEAAEFECSLDGGLFEGCEEGPQPLPGQPWIDHLAIELTLGTHILRVRAVDEAGLFDPTPASYTWTIVMAPETRVVDGPEDPTSDTSATISFASTPPAAHFECSLDEAAYATCVSPVTYTDLSLGWHTLAVRGVDSDGHVDISPAVHGWTVQAPAENTPPDTLITLAPDPITVSTSATFRLSASELGTTYKCSLDNAPYSPCAPRTTYTELAVGPHTFRAQATDAAGNVEVEPATYSWTIVDGDATPPETYITNAPHLESTSADATFGFGATEQGVTYQCSLNLHAFETCFSPHTYYNLGAGDYQFFVRAIDADGNVDPSPALWEWTLEDVVPPNTSLVELPANPSGSSTARFGFTGTDNTTFLEGEIAEITFECRLDSQSESAWSDCLSPEILTGLAAGLHTFQVRAIDHAGNVDPTPAEYTWSVVDGTPPNSTIDSGPTSGTQSTSAILTFSADEDGSTFECSLDGAAFSPCTSPVQYTGLAVGSHELQVRATDPSGNVDLTPASYVWTIVAPPDTTNPETTIDTGPPAETGRTDATLTFSSNEAASFQCSLDGQAFNTCVSPLTYTGLSVGVHQLRVRAIDAAGNSDLTPAVRNWRVTPAPETTIDSVTPDMGVDRVTESTTVTFTFSASQSGATLECALDQDIDFDPCTSPVTYTDLVAGPHEFLVRAVGAEGNVEPAPAAYEWEIGDITPPVVTIDSYPPISTLEPTAEFTFHADDPAATFQCSLDGSLFVVCASPRTYTEAEIRAANDGVLAGMHEFQVHGLVHNLLVDPVPAVYEWQIDDPTAPETTIVSGPPAEIAYDVVEPAINLNRFYFSSNEPDAVFECSIDPIGIPEFSQCASPPENMFDPGLEIGSHTLLVRAVDPSLNADLTPETYSWTVVGPPITTITGGPAEGAIVSETADGSVTFTFAADQSGVTYKCSLDGADPPTACTSPITYTAAQLAGPEVDATPYGEHTFEVEATNRYFHVEEQPASRTWIINDQVAPETRIDAGPSATTYSTTVSFTFGSNEPLVTYECSLNGAEYAGCDTPFELSDLALGSYTLQVRATDTWLNVDTTPASRSWTVAVPVLPNTPAGTNVEADLSTGPAGASVTFAEVSVPGYTELASIGNAPALLPGYVTTGAAYYDVSTTAEYSSPVTVCLPYNPADYSLPVRMLHHNGEIWVDITLSVDEIAHVICGAADGLSPFAVAAGDTTVVAETTIESGPDALTPLSTATFTFSSNGGIVDYQCLLDYPLQLDWNSCDSPHLIDNLLPGSHELQVRAVNTTTGNADATPATHGWTVTAPDTTIVSGPETTTTETWAYFEFISNDPLAEFDCSLDGLEYGGCDNPLLLENLLPQAHQILVRARNDIGTVDPTPASYTWTQTAVPDTAIIQRPADPTDSRTARFTFTSNLSGVTFECALDEGVESGGFFPCASGITYFDLVFGEHDFAVRAKDAAGNVDATPAEWSWSIGGLAPPVLISSGPDVTTENRSATFVFAAEGRDIQYECAFDGGEFSLCLSPKTYNGIPLGPHTFHVQVFVDEETDAEAEETVYEWTVIDTVAPETNIVWGPANPSYTNDPETGLALAAFAVESNDAMATFQCALDGASFTSCPDPIQYTGLTPGPHTLRVRAVDVVLNIDTTPAQWTWNVILDTTPPVTTINNAAIIPEEGTFLAIFSFSANEPVSEFECKIDLEPFEQCESPMEYSDLAVGNHTFRVRAIDFALNFEHPPVTRTFSVGMDSTPPETTILNGPPPSSPDDWASFELQSNEEVIYFECAIEFEPDVGPAWEECFSPAQFVELEPGQYTFQARAVDLSLNRRSNAGDLDMDVRAALAHARNDDLPHAAQPTADDDRGVRVLLVRPRDRVRVRDRR